MMKVFEQLILKKFDALRYSRSARANRGLNENLSKLAEINKFFPFEDFSEMKKLYVEKLQAEVNEYSSSEVSRLLSLISDVKEEIVWDRTELISSLIDSLDSLDYTDDISLLEECFPEEYDEFYNEIESKLEEIIDSEIFMIDDEDLDDLNNLKDKIEDIEMSFNMSFISQINELEEKIEKLENQEDEEEDEVDEGDKKQETVGAKKVIKVQVEKVGIETMFKTLKK